MYKYVINDCFGGFGLSQKALEYLRDKKGWRVAPREKTNNMYHSDVLKLIEEGYRLYEHDSSIIGPLVELESRSELTFRADPDIVEVVEKLGAEANDRCSYLKVIECPIAPDSNLLEIDDYDGVETLQTIPKRFN